MIEMDLNNDPDVIYIPNISPKSIFNMILINKVLIHIEGN
jgi:hypothetical protein